MFLHEAIIKLLEQFGRPMTTTEIANELNTNKWYQKKDGSLITSFQIHGRTKNYPQYFMRTGSMVSLHCQSIHTVEKPRVISRSNAKELSVNSTSTADTEQLARILMDEKNFKSALKIDNIVPNSPGLYCVRIKEISKLPKYFAEHLADRKHNIIYIGIASQSLNDRLNQELRAKGHGTFFRSIGAVLGFRPPKGSLVTKANKRNYKFSAPDEEKIIAWINDNLTVNWIGHSRDLESIESELITEYRPLINIDKNPFKLQLLLDLRAECVRIANETDM
jgi:hypothetical protein